MNNCRKSFLVKSGIRGRLINILYDDIVFVETAQNYVQIHLRDEKITAYLTLSEIAELLPKSIFYRIHQSFVVNFERVKVIDPNQVTLDNKLKLPIGRVYKEPFYKSINQFVANSKRENCN